MFNHIMTSIIGSHPCNQDAIKYFENEDKIIAVVADGLGSRINSADGAKLICRFMVRELKMKKLPINPIDITSPYKWHKHLSRLKFNHDDYCTTCSFVVIDKKAKLLCVGQIGDSPVFFTTDDNHIDELRQKKDFSNITDCLGGSSIKKFTIHNKGFKSKICVLITSDGFGDELNSSSLDSLFSYLIKKYQGYKPNARSSQFTKEMKTTIGNVNNDDKSAIFIWSA